MTLGDQHDCAEFKIISDPYAFLDLRHWAPTSEVSENLSAHNNAACRVCQTIYKQSKQVKTFYEVHNLSDIEIDYEFKRTYI